MENCKLLKHYAGMDRKRLFDCLQEKGNPEKPAEIFSSRHFQYLRPKNTGETGSSLTETIDLLRKAGRIIDDALLEACDKIVSTRLTSDLKRFRYTENIVCFIYHLARVRMLENQGRCEAAAAEARALHTYGETLRAEEEMTADIRGFGYKHPEFYYNGLTGTWFPAAYEKLMIEYGLEKNKASNKIAANRKDEYLP